MTHSCKTLQEIKRDVEGGGLEKSIFTVTSYVDDPEYLRVQRLLWIGHIQRMNESDRVPKKCLLRYAGRNETARSSKGAVHGAHRKDPKKIPITGWKTEAMSTSNWKQIFRAAYDQQIRRAYIYLSFLVGFRNNFLR
jgi:hypothetical protein